MNYKANPEALCSPNEVINGSRNDCTSGKQCLENVLPQCDVDPGCFGISLKGASVDQELKLCKSSNMTPNQDGWTTYIKQKGNLMIFLKRIELSLRLIHFNTFLKIYKFFTLHLFNTVMYKVAVTTEWCKNNTDTWERIECNQTRQK